MGRQRSVLIFVDRGQYLCTILTDVNMYTRIRLDFLRPYSAILCRFVVVLRLFNASLVDKTCVYNGFSQSSRVCFVVKLGSGILTSVRSGGTGLENTNSKEMIPVLV